MYIFVCIRLNRSKPAPFFFCPSLQSLYLAMTRGRAVCWQARRQRECPSQVGRAEPCLATCSDAPIANAIPPKFQHPRAGAQCHGLGGTIEVLAPQCKPEDVVVQLHAAEPALCRQHLSHRLLLLFLSVLADCFPHAPEGIVVKVLHVKAASMQTRMQRLLSCVEQSCM